MAQSNKVEGTIIKDFGATFKVERPDVVTDTTATFKLILDVASSADDRDVLNKNIETAARFLNMHTDAGMSKEQLIVAMTIHGGAWQDVLTDEAYTEKYGIPNPNTALINALAKQDVEIILCGQTAGARGLDRNNVNSNVKFALSAMTALIQYQNKGYTFIKF